MLNKYVLLVGLLLFSMGVLSQIKKVGYYHVANYSVIHNSLIAPTYAIIQDPNGVMYFGTSRGLSIFDGKNWQLIKLPNNSGVTAIKLGDDNVVYLGGMNELGYLKVNEKGEVVYKSLLEKIQKDFTGTGNVTNIFNVGGGVLFVSDNELILYKNKRCTFIKDVNYYGGSFIVNDKIVIDELYEVFKEYSNGKLIDFPLLKKLKGNEIDVICQWGKDKIFAIDNEKGCYLVSKAGVKLLSVPVADFILKNKVTRMVKLKKDNLVLGTLKDGILITDSALNPIQHISKINGLENDRVLSLYEDSYSNLWVGHDMGVSFIDLSSPFTLIEPIDQGIGFSAVLFQHKLYLGTTQGVFVSSWPYKYSAIDNVSKPAIVTNTTGQSWNLNVLGDKLYESHYNGFFHILNNKANKTSPSTSSWKLYNLQLYKDYVLQGTYSGFSLFKMEGGALNYIRQLAGFNMSCRIFEVDTEGYIWITHGYEGVFRARLNKELTALVDIKFYGKDNGFPSNLGINVWKIKENLLFTSEYGGIYMYNKDKDCFEKTAILSEYFGDLPKLSKLFEDNSGNIWYFAMDSTGVLIKSENGKYVISDQPFVNVTNTLVRGFELVYTIDEKNIIFGTVNGFLHYDPSIKKDYKAKFNVLINRVDIITERDSVLYSGVMVKSQNANFSEVIPHKYNSLRFSFIAPFFEQTNKTKYSYYLEGFDKGWSDWTSMTIREYTNLSGGKYIFHVKAKNVYNFESAHSSFAFEVKPHFMLSWYAYVVYIILFVLLVKLLVYINSRKKIAKYHRESLIKEKEIIYLKNKQLNTEIEFKNKELGSLTMHMLRRKEILMNIKNKLDEIYDLVSPKVKNSIDIINKNIESDVNSDKDWEFLQVNFDNVYIGFLKKLKEQFPDLRTSELQLCAYIRMGLSNKEIATLMNSTLRGVEAYRYRLRKNLGLEHDSNIKDFLFNLIS